MKKISVFILMLCLCFNVQADEESERTDLVKIVEELDYIITRIDVIQKKTSTQARIKFNYNFLKKDLINVRQGITDQIQSNLNAGRVLQPIKGQYR